MLIAVNRIYITSGVEAEVLLNTDYIIKVESIIDMGPKIGTRVILDSKRPANEQYDVIYLRDTLNGIKTKVGLIRNNRRKSGTKKPSK